MTRQKTKRENGYRAAGPRDQDPGSAVRRRRRAGTAAVASAAVLAATLAGCASKDMTVQPESVSTSSAASAVAQAQDATCPSSAPKTLTSNVSGLSTEMQPLAATKVLLCVYPGHFGVVSSASPTPSATASASTHLALTDQTVVNSLTDALNALAPPPTEPVNCPMDTGGSVLAIFTAGQQEVEVLMTTSGCEQATNGQKKGWVGASDFAHVLAAALKG